MLRNYFTIALRRLFRQFSYTAINVTGLSVGVAAFLMIMLYIQYHLSFDQHLPELDQWYRVVQVQQADGIGEQHVAFNMGPLSERLKSDLPEVVDACRIMNWGAQSVKVNDTYFSQENVAWTDPSIFGFFGIRLLQGDASQALNEPASVVISETVAKKFFGSADDAMGKTLELNNETGYLVTGIMEDQPLTSHMQLEMLVAYLSALKSYPWLEGWGSNSMSVYVKLDEGADQKLVTEKIKQGIEDFYMETERGGFPPGMYLQPVADIHLRSSHIKFQNNYQQGDFRLVLVFVVVGILIILIACINYINLAIARSVKRAKEVGVRKVMGANRSNLVYQFMGESMIISMLALILSLVIVEFSLPWLNSLLDTQFRIQFVSNSVFNIGLLGIWVFISLFAGIYPAFFMSRYQAIDVLKGGLGSKSVKGTKSFFGKALVVFQFTVAITLIFVVVVTNRQIRYVMAKDVGYNYEKVLAVYLQGGNSEQKAAHLKPLFEQISGVEMVAAASFINGVAGNQSTIHADDSAGTALMARFGYVDEDFFPLMQIPVIKGRYFSKDFPSDQREGVILNESAANYFGWDDPIGKRFRPIYGDDSLTRRSVIGVISDYHYYSVHNKIEPAIWYINPPGFYTLAIRFSGVEIKELAERLEAVWNQHYPNAPFDYVVAAERLERQYRNDKNSLNLFTVFTLLSLMISMLGLYGLTALRVEQRTREIGIRKVLGGSTGQIVQMVLREFLVLVLVAGVIALPLGYLAANQMLSQFAYSITTGPLDALVSLLAASVIAFFTIIFHARRAAQANPVHALKYE